MLKKLFAFVLVMVVALSLGAGAAFAEGEAKINKFKDGKLNLNAATMEDLMALDGMTGELAQSIIDTREENGEFVDMEELLDIDGVDNTLLRKLKKQIYLEPASDCNC